MYHIRSSWNFSTWTYVGETPTDQKHDAGGVPRDRKALKEQGATVVLYYNTCVVLKHKFISLAHLQHDVVDV